MSRAEAPNANLIEYEFTGTVMIAKYKVHLIALALVVLAELAGKRVFNLGIGTIVLLPMLYALLMGMLLGPKCFKLVSLDDMKKVSPFVAISVMLLMARYGTLIGPQVDALIKAGPAFLLQELGNLASILVAMPVALMLGLGRASVGATHSIAREPNVALISDLFGLESEEGRGVMGVYICGTLFGTIFFALFAGWMTATPLHPLALAMASGVGSASMSVAAAGSLATVLPEMEAEILAYAATSNLLTGATGLYASMFIGLPLASWLHRVWPFGRNK